MRAAHLSSERPPLDPQAVAVTCRANIEREGLIVLAGLLTVTTLNAGGIRDSRPILSRTVTADQEEVTLGRGPTGIVSLSPSLTEMLFAIGAGKQVVAVDEHSDYPARRPEDRPQRVPSGISRRSPATNPTSS